LVALDVLSTILSSCWDILGFEIPGFGFTCKAFLTALLLIGISIKAVQFAFGFGSGGTGYRSGQSRSKRISNERKNDEK